MIMTFQNPLDWASEMYYDSENEKLELSKNPEIILKTYFNLIEYFLRGCEIINKKFGKLCFMARIEDIIANPRKFSKFCFETTNFTTDKKSRNCAVDNTSFDFETFKRCFPYEKSSPI